MTTKKPTIVVLLAIPLTEQNYKRNGIPYLRENFDVVVLDCNAWQRPAGYSSMNFTKYDYSDTITIANADEFKKVVSRLKPAYAIESLAYSRSMQFMQKTLQAHGTKFVVRSLGIGPAAPITAKTKNHLSSALKDPGGFLVRGASKFFPPLIGRRRLAPDVALLAGRKSLNAFTARAKVILWVPTIDLYTYRAVQKKSENQGLSLPFKGRFNLFIDTCMALSADYQLIGVSAPVEPDDYFASLRRAFERIERITGSPMVIASHPNGKDIENYSSLFGERRVYFDITAELCSQSDMVFTDGSTALSFAVLGEKPIVILMARSLNNSNQGASIRELSVQLECPLLYLDSNDDEYESACDLAAGVCVEAYDRFIDNYIMTNDVDEDAPWQSLTDLIHQNG